LLNGLLSTFFFTGNQNKTATVVEFGESGCQSHFHHRVFSAASLVDCNRGGESFSRRAIAMQKAASV
jgi:hypothetical protein